MQLFNLLKIFPSFWTLGKYKRLENMDQNNSEYEHFLGSCSVFEMQ